MTAAELAGKVGAKGRRNGPWLARCPIHGIDKHPSVSISVGKRHPVVIECQSHHCDRREILRAWGLTMRDLCAERSDGKLDPAIRERVRDERRLAMLERRLGLVTVLLAIEPGKHNYWLTAEKRIRAELKALTFKLQPGRRIAYEFQVRVRREGWDRIMNEWMASEDGKKTLETL